MTNTCPFCEKPTQSDFLACPHCGETIAFNCPGCGKHVDTLWATCPYCKSDLPKKEMDLVQRKIENADLVRKETSQKEEEAKKQDELENAPLAYCVKCEKYVALQKGGRGAGVCGHASGYICATKTNVSSEDEKSDLWATLLLLGSLFIVVTAFFSSNSSGFVAIGVCGSILSAVVIYGDAKLRHKDPIGWVLFALLIWPVALIIWLITRPDIKK